MKDIKNAIGGNSKDLLVQMETNKAKEAESYPELAAMEKEQQDTTNLTDQELFDANPFPESIEGEGGDEVELVSGPAAREQPKKYGPFEVKEVRDARANDSGRFQKSVRATLHFGAKRIPFLVSCFDENLRALDVVEIGAMYNFRGFMKRKIARVNGEKVVSFYLNIA